MFFTNQAQWKAKIRKMKHRSKNASNAISALAPNEIRIDETTSRSTIDSKTPRNLTVSEESI